MLEIEFPLYVCRLAEGHSFAGVIMMAINEDIPTWILLPRRISLRLYRDRIGNRLRLSKSDAALAQALFVISETSKTVAVACALSTPRATVCYAVNPGARRSLSGSSSRP
jgi:hypothetical protein